MWALKLYRCIAKSIGCLSHRLLLKGSLMQNSSNWMSSTIIHFDDGNFAKIMSHTLNFIAVLAELIVNTSKRQTIDTIISPIVMLWMPKWNSLIYLHGMCLLCKFIHIRMQFESETVISNYFNSPSTMKSIFQLSAFQHTLRSSALSSIVPHFTNNAVDSTLFKFKW